MLSADDDKLKNEIPSNSEQGKKFRKGIEERKRKKEKEREKERERKKEREGMRRMLEGEIEGAV